MLKQYILILISVLTLNSYCFGAFSAVDEVELHENKIYLVHVTPFLMRDSTAIAGAAIKKTPKERVLLPSDSCMETRKTLHHCMGGVVPPEAMSSAVNVLGANVSSGFEEFDAPYAYLDLMSAFLERKEVFGGQLNDIFTTSHTYGSGSIVVVPVSAEEDFNQRNPNFEGKLITYDPNLQNLRGTIDKILSDKKATKIALFDKKENLFSPPLISNYNKVKINEDEVPLSIFEKFFQERSIGPIHHGTSHFMMLEDMLRYFRMVFIAFQQGVEEPWKVSLPSRHIEPLAALVEFEFEMVFKAAAHINERHLEDLRNWQRDCLAFIKLHRFENELRKENKSLFHSNPNFAHYLKTRHDLDLDTLRKELNVLEPHLMMELEKKTETPAMGLCVPYYYEGLSFNILSDYITCVNFVKERLKDWRHGPSIILINLFKRYFLSKESTQEMISALNFGINELSSQTNQELKKYINEQFWQSAIKDTSPEASTVLSLVNHPDLSANMRWLLGLPLKETNPEDITFAPLLEVCPACNLLFNDDAFKKATTFQSAGFSREWFRSQVKDILPYAVLINQVFVKKAHDLIMCPLGEEESAASDSDESNEEEESSEEEESGKEKIYNVVKVIKEECGLTGRPEEILINFGLFKNVNEILQADGLHLIKLGLYGSLDEIFDSMELLREFRGTYPTDEAFWSPAPGKTFNNVYHMLRRMKKDNAKQKKEA